MEAFTSYKLVERVLARGDTKSSVLIWGGFQADLRVVPRESVGAALQYFTGSKAHNIALRDRAINRGFKLNEYGLFRVENNELVAGADEPGIYAALGLAFVPPELRENRGELQAAEAGTLPRLLSLSDLRGDLHMHTTVTDGRADAETMARAAQSSGLEYVAITDHSQALAMANGLNEVRALEQAAAIRALNDRVEGITVLAGIECDIRADGTMDLADDCLAQLDIVIASIQTAFTMDEAQMTERILRAIANPYVDIIGHPTGRLILKREGYRIHLEQILAAARDAGVAMEINSQVDRLDLDDAKARIAKEHGVKLIIDSDAHSTAGLGALRWGALTARRAWLEPGDVLNTQTVDRFVASLRRNRVRPA
jgi:DNA polymerase (family 10)